MRRHDRNTYAILIAASMLATGGVLLAAILLPTTTRASAYGDHSGDRDYATRVAQANAVFDCLQQSAPLRSAVRTIMAHRYRVQLGHTARFAEIRARHMLTHRHFFLELNTPFNWRDLGDPLMNALHLVCLASGQTAPQNTPGTPAHD